jgi:RNA polymerase sigma-70 factor, ECF subfamily
MQVTKAKKPFKKSASIHDADRELAALAAGGDPGARRKVAELLFERVRTTVRYISANDRDREDWVQLAMLEILSSLRGFQGVSSLASWADRITVRTAMRHLKRRRRREEKVGLAADPHQGTKNASNDSGEQLMVRSRIASILEEIDSKPRIAVVLRLVHGYSVDEISAMTSTPRDTIKGRLKRGRKQLRNRIEEDSWLMDWANSGKL